MDTTTSYIDNTKIGENPALNRNIAGLPQIDRTTSRGVVRSSIIPIIKRINTTLLFKIDPTGTFWTETAVGHGIGKIYYVFTRWRIKSDAAWTMCPQPNYDNPANDMVPRFSFFEIKESYISFLYFDPAIATPKDTEIEVDIYFVDIPFNL